MIISKKIFNLIKPLVEDHTKYPIQSYTAVTDPLYYLVTWGSYGIDIQYDEDIQRENRVYYIDKIVRINYAHPSRAHPNGSFDIEHRYQYPKKGEQPKDGTGIASSSQRYHLEEYGKHWSLMSINVVNALFGIQK